MFTFVSIIHILMSLILIIIVLLQTGKGSDLASAFGGGGSQTLFGSHGAASFLNKLTTVAAIMFMVTSLTLAIISAKPEESFMDDFVNEEETTSEAAQTSNTNEIDTEATLLDEGEQSEDMSTSTEATAPDQTNEVETSPAETSQDSSPSQTEE